MRHIESLWNWESYKHGRLFFTTRKKDKAKRIANLLRGRKADVTVKENKHRVIVILHC